MGEPVRSRKGTIPMKTMSLIINPNAGTRQGRRFLADILTIFSDADYLPTVFITKPGAWQAKPTWWSPAAETAR